MKTEPHLADESHREPQPADPALQAAAIGLRLDEQLRKPTTASQEVVEEAYQALNQLALLVPTCDALSPAYASIAHFYYLTALPLSGVEPAQRAVDAARLNGDLSRLRLALSFQALIFSETAALPAAHAVLQEALDCAERLSDPAAQCNVWNLIGIVLQLQSRSREAVAAFERVLEIADTDASLLRFRTAALANIALACTDIDGDVGHGIRAAHAALALVGEPKTAPQSQSRVALEAIATRLLIEVSQLDSARTHAEAATRYAKGVARAEVMAKMARGLVEVASGKHDVGFTLLRQALDTARHTVKALHMPALQTVIKGYEMAGQLDVASVYLEELMRLNRESKTAMLLEHHHKYVDALLDKWSTADEVEATLNSKRSRLTSGLSQRDVHSLTRMLEEHAIAAELHDDETGAHCFRVGRLASILGRTIGLSDDVCFLIDLAARLHDVGKLFVPDAILLKPGKLTLDERTIMQTHTTSGADFLAKANVPQMHIAEEIARHHHERWDGTGYPDRLAGSAIPIAARVAALSDVFDALTHVRPYKRAWSVDESLEEIRSLRGKAFDPELTDIFLALVPALQREHGDLDSFLAAEASNSTFVATRRQLAEKLKGRDPTVTAFDLRR